MLCQLEEISHYCKLAIPKYGTSYPKSTIQKNDPNQIWVQAVSHVTNTCTPYHSKQLLAGTEDNTVRRTQRDSLSVSHNTYKKKNIHTTAPQLASFATALTTCCMPTKVKQVL